jgi:hypothetical protein
MLHIQYRDSLTETSTPFSLCELLLVLKYVRFTDGAFKGAPQELKRGDSVCFQGEKRSKVCLVLSAKVRAFRKSTCYR